VSALPARPPQPIATSVRPERAGLLGTFVLLAAMGVGLFVLRLTGVPNLMDNEYRLGACVLDVLQHGNWLCPHDVLGNTDKPPMLTWLAALASWPLGRVTPFTLYLPTALATIVTAWCIAGATARYACRRAALFAGLTYLLSDVAAHQMATARWDGLFALTVTGAALLAFRAWTTGRGWTWFWLVAAAATLTKGPLGVLLSLLGLGAIVWERRTGHARPLSGSHAAGVALFLAVTLGWFLLAYRQVGPHLVQNMIGEEFVGNIVEHRVAYRFWKPLGDFVANFAPWSLITFVGLHRILRAPAASDEARRFERFLWCWFVGGLVLLSVSPHNQARLMDPIIPAAAMITGPELDRRLGQRSRRTMVALLAAAVVAMFAVFMLLYHRLERSRPGVRETVALQGLAGTIRRTLGPRFPVTYVDNTPFAIQLLLDTMRPPVSCASAAHLLGGAPAAVVAVRDVRCLRRALGPDTVLHELASATDGSTTYVRLVSNSRNPVEPIATGVGPLVVTLRGVRLGSTWDNVIVLERVSDTGWAAVENASSTSQDVAVRIAGAPPVTWALAPGARREITVP
jgi:4-amino-4-deoxy-L-arabinose transferase-like glycosyltransferase